MAYSTVQQVRKALVPTSDGNLPTVPSNTAADLSDAQIADHIAEADSLIDGYLAKWYVVPVAGSPTPVPIGYWSRNVAAYEATLTFRGSMDMTDNDPVVRRYKQVIDALKAVAKGDMKLDLPVAAGTDSHAAGGAGSPVNPYKGDLWTPDDFSLAPGDSPGNGSAPLPYWRSL